MRPDFSDSALLLIGHGTRFDPDAATPVYRQASELRCRRVFGVVREGFWKQEPRLLDVLPTLAFPRVFVVPFFASEGYFCERVIPKSLGFRAGRGPGWSRVQARGAQALFYCKPVGTHRDMVDIALHRAGESVSLFPFPRAPRPADTSLFIAGHGTERTEKSRAAIERLVELIRAARVYRDVQAIYLEEAPRIAACYQLAHTGNIVIVPFFVGEGPHVKQDIPVALGQSDQVVRLRLEAGQWPWRNPTEKHGKLVWYAQPIGTDPRMADIVLDRVREAVRWPLPAAASGRQPTPRADCS